MIHAEAWYREAVRPIPVDPKDVEEARDLLFEEIEATFEVHFSKINKFLPPGYLWAPNWGPKIMVNTVMGQRLSIPLNIYLTPFTGFMTVEAFLTLTNPRVLAIVLPLAGMPGPLAKDVLDHSEVHLRGQVYSAVLHELTHARDRMVRPTYDAPYAGLPEDESLSEEEMEESRRAYFETYFNDSSEVRAHMQQVAWETLENLRNVEKSPNDETQPPVSWKEALSKSTTWESIQEYLTPENRKKVLQGVVRNLQDQGISLGI